MPTESHERVVAFLVRYFGNWCEDHGGTAYPSGYKVCIDERHGFMPDVQVYLTGNRSERDEQAVYGAPDIAVEVLSEGSVNYDKKAKLLGYARVGVAEYWVVSPFEESVERLVLRRKQYVVEGFFTRKDIVTTPLCPGLKIPVAKMFSLGAPAAKPKKR